VDFTTAFVVGLALQAVAVVWSCAYLFKRNLDRSFSWPTRPADEPVIDPVTGLRLDGLSSVALRNALMLRELLGRTSAS
jgi:hypothetical protein